MTIPLYKRVAAAAALAVLATLPAKAQTAPDVQALLKAADKYRMSADNLQVETQVLVVNADGSTDKERRYTVFAQADRQSLVLMRSPAETGQLLLSSGGKSRAGADHEGSTQPIDPSPRR